MTDPRYVAPSPRRPWLEKLKSAFWFLYSLIASSVPIWFSLIAACVAVVVGIAAWPWPETVWWGFGAAGAIWWINSKWQDRERAIRLRHEELGHRLGNINRQVTDLQHEIASVKTEIRARLK
jgi:hypothetical protein